ncbi:MAG: PilZ domain-containing protein [bacterium]|nr:PilZ domain-containing protein [bacterium]
MALPNFLRKKAVSPTVDAAAPPTSSEAEPANHRKEQRRWPRSPERVPLEASTNASDPNAAWPVKLQEDSPGGVAIGSKRPVSVGSLLFVRAKPPWEPNTWMCGEVAHCTEIRGGFMIGLRMDHRLPADLSD